MADRNDILQALKGGVYSRVFDLGPEGVIPAGTPDTTDNIKQKIKDLLSKKSVAVPDKPSVEANTPAIVTDRPTIETGSIQAPQQKITAGTVSPSTNGVKMDETGVDRFNKIAHSAEILSNPAVSPELKQATLEDRAKAEAGAGKVFETNGGQTVIAPDGSTTFIPKADKTLNQSGTTTQYTTFDEKGNPVSIFPAQTSTAKLSGKADKEFSPSALGLENYDNVTSIQGKQEVDARNEAKIAAYKATSDAANQLNIDTAASTVSEANKTIDKYNIISEISDALTGITSNIPQGIFNEKYRDALVTANAVAKKLKAPPITEKELAKSDLVTALSDRLSAVDPGIAALIRKNPLQAKSIEGIREIVNSIQNQYANTLARAQKSNSSLQKGGDAAKNIVSDNLQSTTKNKFTVDPKNPKVTVHGGTGARIILEDSK